MKVDRPKWTALSSHTVSKDSSPLFQGSGHVEGAMQTSDGQPKRRAMGYLSHFFSPSSSLEMNSLERVCRPPFFIPQSGHDAGRRKDC